MLPVSGRWECPLPAVGTGDLAPTGMRRNHWKRTLLATWRDTRVLLRQFRLPLALFVVSVLAGAANTPIAMSILAIELFGPSIAPYAAVSCVISFLMTGHRSVFPAQRIAATKSSSVDVEIGGEVGDARSEYKRRDKSLIDTGIKVADKLRKKKD